MLETRFTLPVNAALGEYSITLVRKGRRVSGAEQAANPRDDGIPAGKLGFSG